MLGKPRAIGYAYNLPAFSGNMLYSFGANRIYSKHTPFGNDEGYSHLGVEAEHVQIILSHPMRDSPHKQV